MKISVWYNFDRSENLPFSGTLVQKRSISSISSRVVMVSKNCPQGLPLKFPGASFGAIKKFSGWFFIGSFTGSGPEMTIIVDSDRVFRLGRTYTTYIWRFIITEITVIEVMALKCQKKVRSSSRKKAQVLSHMISMNKNIVYVKLWLGWIPWFLNFFILNFWTKFAVLGQKS